ncbi:MAG: hypothetical protein V2A73_09415 [Pseudomonadota bacterium]
MSSKKTGTEHLFRHRPFLGALALQLVLVLVLENTALSSRPRAVFE